MSKDNGGVLSVKEAQALVEKARALVMSTKRATPERLAAVFVELDAEKRLRAALRAEKTPQTICNGCGKRLRKGEPLVAHQRFGHGLTWGFLCLRCAHDREPLDLGLRGPVSDLKHLDLHPCPTCARPMYFSRYIERAVPCSYQCAHRRKLEMQQAKRRVQHQTIACAECGEMFEPTRSDAEFCSSRCRQKAYRKRKAVTVTDDDFGQPCTKSTSRNANESRNH
jgi:hypothetical protein